MHFSRRRFLETGSKLGFAAIVTGGLGSIAFGQQKEGPALEAGLGAEVPRAALNDPLYNISRAMFKATLKTPFGVSLGGVKITTLTLIEVNELAPAFAKNNGTTSRDCFSLVFTAPGNRTLGQNTYTLDHSELGGFQLFVVQGKRVGSEIRYGAIINRVFP